VKKKILAISGSTRKDSSNDQLIKLISELSAGVFEISLFDISKLPYFSQDIDNGALPKSVIDLRKAIEMADGVLICTPEYVFSIPGILKNALEWTVSTIVFSDKPTAVITASSSGIKCHESLLLVMETLGTKLPGDSTLLIQSIKSKLIDGKMKDETTFQQLKKLIHSLNQSI
jgi:chromate reductase